jgi:hypothetical protein
VRPGLALEPVVYGGGQEHGRRAGTENVAFAVALGAAAQLCADERARGENHRIRALRDRLHQHLIAQVPAAVELNGHPELRLPHTLNVSIAGLRGDQLLDAILDLAAPPARPATPAPPNLPRCFTPWATTIAAPSPRSGFPSADGPPVTTSTVPAAC